MSWYLPTYVGIFIPYGEHTCTNMERVVNTLVQYKDPSGRQRTKITKKFDHRTNLFHVKNWILTWWRGGRNFDVEIKDQHGRFVDFDDEYITEFKPFDVSEPIQPSTSTSSETELRIIDIDDDRQSQSTAGSEDTSTKRPSTSMQIQHQALTAIAEQPIGDVQQVTSQNRFSGLCASHPITTDEKKAGMKFTKDVNDIQRDQYKSDKTSPGMTKRTGYYVRIQADKKGLDEKARHGTVMPKLKIPHSIIPINERSAHTLLIFLVNEVCENGKRKFYHHEERQFIIDDNEKMNQSTPSVNNRTPSEDQDKGNFRREPIILRLTDKMFSENGESLDLKTTVILQTKTHPHEDRLLFCELTNEYPSNTKYETTRLACVLEKNGDILWQHLIFSNAMIYPKSTDDIGDIEVKDDNGTVIEKIPVRILKRKKNLNQPDNITKRPPRGRKARQNEAQTDTSNPQTNQDHQTQTMDVPLQNSREHPTSATEGRLQGPNPQNEHAQYRNQMEYPVTGGQFQGPDFQNQHLQHQNQVPYSIPMPRGQYQDSNYQNEQAQYQNQVGYHGFEGQFQGPDIRNEHLRYQNQVQYSMPFAGGQYQDPNFLNGQAHHQYMVSSHPEIENLSNPQYMLQPMRTNNCTDEVLRDQPATTIMNSCSNQSGRTNEEIEMHTPTTSSQSENTTNPMFFDFLPHQQQQTPSQGFSSLANIQSLLAQSMTNIPSQEAFLSPNDEDFSDTDEFN